MQKSPRTLAKLFASTLGIGFSPLLPGTLASFLGVLLYLLVARSTFWYLSVVGALCGLGFVASHRALQATEEKDPSWIVMDEVVGMMISFFQIPSRIPLLVIGFALFRFFDSVKVPPLDRFEKLKGEWGIFLDDIGAGIYTNLVLHVIIQLTS